MRVIFQEIYPLLRRISSLSRTITIWHDTPPVSDGHAMNNHNIEAMNYMTKILLEPLGIIVIPAATLSLVWSEDIGPMESHIMHNYDLRVVPTYPGVVASFAVAYAACQEYVTDTNRTYATSTHNQISAINTPYMA